MRVIPGPAFKMDIIDCTNSQQIYKKILKCQSIKINNNVMNAKDIKLLPPDHY